jgi:hypothetical protein
LTQWQCGVDPACYSEGEIGPNPIDTPVDSGGMQPRKSPSSSDRKVLVDQFNARVFDHALEEMDDPFPNKVIADVVTEGRDYRNAGHG